MIPKLRQDLLHAYRHHLDGADPTLRNTVLMADMAAISVALLALIVCIFST